MRHDTTRDGSSRSEIHPSWLTTALTPYCGQVCGAQSYDWGKLGKVRQPELSLRSVGKRVPELVAVMQQSSCRTDPRSRTLRRDCQTLSTTRRSRMQRYVALQALPKRHAPTDCSTACGTFSLTACSSGWERTRPALQSCSVPEKT